MLLFCQLSMMDTFILQFSVQDDSILSDICDEYFSVLDGSILSVVCDGYFYFAVFCDGWFYFV